MKTRVAASAYVGKPAKFGKRSLSHSSVFLSTMPRQAFSQRKSFSEIRFQQQEVLEGRSRPLRIAVASGARKDDFRFAENTIFLTAAGLLAYVVSLSLVVPVPASEAGIFAVPVYHYFADPLRTLLSAF